MRNAGLLDHRHHSFGLTRETPAAADAPDRTDPWVRRAAILGVEGIEGDDRRAREGPGLAGNPAIPGTVAPGPEALRPHLAAGLPFSAFARVMYQQDGGEPSANRRSVTRPKLRISEL